MGTGQILPQKLFHSVVPLLHWDNGQENVGLVTYMQCFWHIEDLHTAHIGLPATYLWFSRCGGGLEASAGKLPERFSVC